VVLICCCVPNFVKIGSPLPPPDAHKCWMFNVPLLGNGDCHGNHIIADMSWTWWNATTHVSSKSVYWEASYGIFNIFQPVGRPPFWILKMLIFDHVTNHWVPNLLSCTKFHQNWFTRSASIQTPITAECSLRRCQITAVAMATASWRTCLELVGCDRSIDRRVIAFLTFCKMAAVRHLEFEFCYSGPPTKSAMRFRYPIEIWFRSDLSRRRYCDFIILPVWLENA